MIKNLLYIFVTRALLLLFPAVSFAGNADSLCRKPLLLHFRFDHSLVEYAYMDNPRTLADFSALFTDSLAVECIDTIHITAYASPDGDARYNKLLAYRRAVAVKGYLIWKYPFLNQYRILTDPQGEDWNGLRQLVEADRAVPDRVDVLAVLDQVHDTARRKQLLRRLNRGFAYHYINKHLLPRLRNAAVCTVRMKAITAEDAGVATALDADVIIAHDTGIATAADTGVMTAHDTDVIATPDSIAMMLSGSEALTLPATRAAVRPFLAVKTNLLIWAGLTSEGHLASIRPNLAAELFFPRRWSVVASAEYSYWKGGKDKEFWGISGYDLEPRFWLDSDKFRWLYLGIYARLGDFDYQPLVVGVDASAAKNPANTTGTYWSTGISLGIYVPFTRHLGLEAGLRAGYRKASGSTYDNEPPHYYYNHDVSATRWGITGVNLSLSYRWWTQTKRR